MLGIEEGEIDLWYEDFKRYLAKKKRRIKIVNECNEFLLEGRYKFTPDLKFIYHIDKSQDNELSGFILKNSKEFYSQNLPKKIAKRFINYPKVEVIKSSSGLNSFKGTIIYFGIDGKFVGNNIKIFDINNMKLLSLFYEHKFYRNKVSNYYFFKNFFSLPDLLVQNKDKLITVENLIDRFPQDSWTNQTYKKVFNKIYSDYLNYFKFCSLNKNFSYYKPIKLINKLEQDEVFYRIANMLQKNFDIEKFKQPIPLIKMHGDLLLKNIFYSKKGKLYYIDFEDSNKFSVFFDLIKLKCHEARKGRTKFLKNYFLGSYDQEMKKILSYFQYEFFGTSEERMYYYNIHLCEHLLSRFSSQYRIIAKLTKRQKENKCQEFLDFYKNFILSDW